ncbi:MAG TPA: hypothetical protein VG368_07755, partial [Acidimicrobiales bacterium]|nr:hypothetical protein [Acidimicrobiales bacterium]
LREATMGVVRDRANRDRRAIESRSSVGAGPSLPHRASPSSLGLARVVVEAAGRRAARVVRRSAT